MHLNHWRLFLKYQKKLKVMSRVLIFDTNFSVKPIYDTLSESGHEVFVIGGNPNDSLCSSNFNWINLNYSDIDKCLQIIEEYSIDYILPGGNDFSYLICSQISEILGLDYLDGYDNSKKINHKDKFRSFCHDNSLHSPKVYKDIDQIDSNLVIIKPSDCYSGRGATKLHNTSKKELYDAIEIAKSFSKNGDCVIEEFVTGDLFSHSAFIENKKIKIDFFVEEYCTANPYTVDTSRVTYDIDDVVKNGIRNDIEKISSLLNLKDGLIHTQFISNSKDFWILEVTRRCPGDLYSELIEMSTGFEYSKAYWKYFLKDSVSSFLSGTKKNIIRHTISTPHGQNYQGLEFFEPVLIKKIINLLKVGENLDKSPFSRVGIIFIEEAANNRNDEIFEKFIDRKIYKFLK